MDSFQFSRHDRWWDLDSLELIFFIKYFIPIVKIQIDRGWIIYAVKLCHKLDINRYKK